MKRLSSGPHVVFTSGLLFLGCGSSNDHSASADCEAARQHVSDCYGEELAASFAETCTAETASEALGDQCETTADGKADLLSTKILSPPVEQFKYGSVGTDKIGLPVVLHRALPIVCEDLLPPGTDPRDKPLAAFGFNYEDGHNFPLGLSRRRLPLIGIEIAG